MAEWFYTSKGESHGPYSEFQIKEMIRIGIIKPTDNLWKPGMANWANADAVRNILLNQWAPPAPPIPIAQSTPHQIIEHKEWQPWQVFLLNLITLGLFDIYLTAYWTYSLRNLHSGRLIPHTNNQFYILLVINILTCGISTFIVKPVYSFFLGWLFGIGVLIIEFMCLFFLLIAVASFDRYFMHSEPEFLAAYWIVSILYFLAQLVSSTLVQIKIKNTSAKRLFI